jgi:hypothetical protein
VLIGSGPSFRREDLCELSAFTTIAFNCSYRDWPRWPSAPDLFACTDASLVVQICEDLQVLLETTETHFYLHQAARALLPAASRVTFVAFASGDGFSRDVTRLADFGNVGATSLQILAARGYRRILLTGVDGRYREVDAAETDEAAGGIADRDHFIPDYRAGLRFDTTTPRNRFVDGWAKAARECARHEIMVRNASRDTALSCFPRCDLECGVSWLGSVH